MSVQSSLTAGIVGPLTALEFNKKIVEEVPFYKYLGVLFDEKLPFQHHIEYALSKARKASFKLFKYTSWVSKNVNVTQATMV